MLMVTTAMSRRLVSCGAVGGAERSSLPYSSNFCLLRPLALSRNPHVPNPNLTSNPPYGPYRAETEREKGAAYFCLRIHNIVGSTSHREE